MTDPSSPSLLQELARSLSLPLLLFSPDLSLNFINDVAEKVLDYTTCPDSEPTAEYFFRKDRLADGSNPFTPLAWNRLLRKQLERLASDCTRMTWSKGCQVQIWNGSEPYRTSRWYEASIQTHEYGHPNADIREMRNSHQKGNTWFSVLLLRALPSSLIPSIFKHSTGSSTGSLHSSLSSVSRATEGKDPEEDPALRLEELLDPLTKDFSLSDAEMRGIVENLPDICMICNTKGMVTYMNPRWYERTGLTPQQSSDVQNWKKLHHADDMPAGLSAWNYAIKTGTPVDVEYRLRRFDGSWHWVVMRAVPVRNADGTIYQWVATVTDVDELVQARSEALRVQERVKAVLAAANVVLISVSRDSIVTFFEGPCNIAPPSKVPSDQFIGLPLGNAWPDPELPTLVMKMIVERLGSLTWQHEQAFVDGRSFRYRLTPLHYNPDDDPEIDEMDGVIIIATDVTDQVAAEAALRLADQERDQLLASERAARESSQFKTAFVTNISHEIRTPIAAMIGISELLLDDPTLEQAHRTLLEKSLKSGELLLDLVGMVLDMGKVEAGKLEIEKRPFHLVELLSVLDLFAIAAEKKGLRFKEDFSREKVYKGRLVGDPLRLRQILANFLANAIKFTVSGYVALRIRHEQPSDPSCIIVTFDVQDTGIGIPEEVLGRLFQPFYQADASTARKHGGSGLGLFLSKSASPDIFCIVSSLAYPSEQFAEMMDGRISIESVQGQGTTVSARIPFRKSQDLPAVSTTAPNILSSGGVSLPFSKAGAEVPKGLNILLAEDNELMREIMQKTLQRMNFHVVTVPGGAEAIAAVQAGHYDLILMDGQMPGIDGYEATRLIRQLPDASIRNVKIIALTASAIRGDKERCLDAGMDGYLTKPIRAGDLKIAILQALKQTK